MSLLRNVVRLDSPTLEVVVSVDEAELLLRVAPQVAVVAHSAARRVLLVATLLVVVVEVMPAVLVLLVEEDPRQSRRHLGLPTRNIPLALPIAAIGEVVYLRLHWRVCCNPKRIKAL